VMKAALQVNVAIERAIEKSLDLIEKAFVKYGDRELADDNLREKDTTILKDTNQPDKA